MSQNSTDTTDKTIRMPYEWSTGEGIGEFLTGLKKGEIRAAVCPDCGDRIVPARSFCKHCHTAVETFERIADAGTLGPHTVVRADSVTAPFDPPYALGTITLDGADTGLLHAVRAEDYASLEQGTRVEAVWRPPAEREGEMLDIRAFEPEGER